VIGNPILIVEDLTKRFDGFTALDGINVAIEPGERLGLIGPNGSGKSTLVNCISGVLPSSAGRVRFDGEDITDLAPHQRIRRGIARTFQIPKPFVSMTALENVCIPLEYSANRNYHGEGIQTRARAILAELDLDSKAGRYPENLTQIDLRKLELARAIAVKPKLLIADEVMAGLASAEVNEILALLLRLADSGLTIIMIEHIMHAVMEFSERLVVLVAGKIVAEGCPDDIVRNPIVEQAYLGE
jgi:branched-chain amino acid transport system ATP-binding protein